jgi:hypothetical protein
MLANRGGCSGGIANGENLTIIFDSKLKSGSFTVILAFNILHFFKDENTLLARINQLLTQDGLLICITGCFNERVSFIEK